ncbi:taurine dioxygenase [Betaproteobacteria bacterium]|nr:taurine dioxygenase [Betaproteobacteria bacterium]GHU40232.1 taurine dioxygenase [Betaproteobacteria bacterium]
MTSASKFTRFQLTPYTPNIGAEITGLDLAGALDTTTAEELRLALAHHGVLFLRDQSLTPARQVEVAQIFGSPSREKTFFPACAEHELVELVETKPGGPRYNTDQWHNDSSYQTAPPAGAVLAARVLPERGGDTLWSCARKVYQTLPAGLADWLETLTALHSIDHSGWGDVFRSQAGGEERYRDARNQHLPVSHPIIKTHPVTGEKFVFASPKYTERIEGISRTQSDDLLAYLFHLFERPEFQARFVWSPNAVAIWDNHATLHYAVPDYLPAYRLMHRVTF